MKFLTKEEEHNLIMKGIVLEYLLQVYVILNESDDSDYEPRDLAYEISFNNISIFAIVSNDDSLEAKVLLDAEARLNAKYYEYGFRIDTTILEESDNIPIPNGYTILTQE